MTSRTDRSVSRSLQPVIRKVFDYSLIPGGVDDASAFRVFRASDKILLRHFRTLGDQLVSTSLSKDKWMFASYRVANSIYWTKNRVLIHAGEALLTDGKELVRSRCGNRLSDSPETPVQTVQPPAITTDRFTVEVAIEMPPLLTPEVETPLIPGFPDIGPPTPIQGPYVPGPPQESGGEVPPFPVPLPPETGGGIYLPTPIPPMPITLPGPGPQPFTTPTIPPLIPTPEPNTWRLTFVGMISLACLSFRLLVRRHRIVLSYRSRDAEKPYRHGTKPA